MKKVGKIQGGVSYKIFLAVFLVLGVSFFVSTAIFTGKLSLKNSFTSLFAQLPTSGDIDSGDMSGNDEGLPLGESCFVNEECSSRICGSVLVDYPYCVQCTQDSDCGANRVCNTEDNKFECELVNTTTQTSDVAFGGDCIQGSCGNSGLKCNTSGKCTQCMIDQQCGTTSSGAQIKCSNDGVCVGPNGLSSKEWCTQNSHCKSKKCTNNKCEPVQSGSGADGSTKDGGDKNGKDSGNGAGNTSGDFDITQGVDLSIDQIISGIVTLACNIQRIGVLIAFIAIVFIGYQYLVYGVYDPTKLKDIRLKLGYVVVGLVVIFGVYIIIATVANAIGIENFSFFSCSSAPNLVPEIDQSLKK